MEQLAHRHQCIVRRDRAVAVDSAVAEGVDHPHLADTASPAAVLKVGSWISALRLSWYGSPQRTVVLIRPRHRQL